MALVLMATRMHDLVLIVGVIAVAFVAAVVGWLRGK
jgi:hypothetical protein